jgi:flagellar biosynthesis GTPase FlhF
MAFLLAFLIYLFLLSALFNGLFYSSWGGQRWIRTLVAYLPIASLVTAVGERSGDIASGGALALLLGPPVARFLSKRLAEQEAQETARAEAQRLADRAAEEAQCQATEERERQQEQERQCQLAEAERTAFEAKRAQARAQREQTQAQQALRGHLDIITAAIRALTPGEHNPVMLTTIDDELNAIRRHPHITPAMVMARLLVEMLDERGVSDRLVLTHLQQILRLQQPACVPAA